VSFIDNFALITTFNNQSCRFHETQDILTENSIMADYTVDRLLAQREFRTRMQRWMLPSCKSIGVR